MVRVRLGLRTAEPHREAGVLSFLLPQASGCTCCLHLFQALGEAPWHSGAGLWSAWLSISTSTLRWFQLQTHSHITPLQWVRETLDHSGAYISISSHPSPFSRSWVWSQNVLFFCHSGHQCNGHLLYLFHDVLWVPYAISILLMDGFHFSLWEELALNPSSWPASNSLLPPGLSSSVSNTAISKPSPDSASTAFSTILSMPREAAYHAPWISRGSPLTKTGSPSLSGHWSPVAFDLRVEHCGVFPKHIGISLVLALCRSCLLNHIVAILWAQFSVTFRRHCPAAGVLVLRLLQSFHPLFCIFLWALSVGVTVQICQLWLGPPWSLSTSL